MAPSQKDGTIEQVHKQPPQPCTTQLPSLPRHLPLPAARASQLPAYPPAARPGPHKHSHKSPNICSATALERGPLPRSVETSSLEIFRRSSGGFFFFSRKARDFCQETSPQHSRKQYARDRRFPWAGLSRTRPTEPPTGP